MSSFQRIGDTNFVSNEEGTPQKQRGRKSQVHSLACRTSASKAPACPPEQHSGDPSIYEDETPEDIEMDRKADLRRCAADLFVGGASEGVAAGRGFSLKFLPTFVAKIKRLLEPGQRAECLERASRHQLSPGDGSGTAVSRDR